MNKQAMIGDIKQVFSELTYEQKLLYRYGYISSSELTEELSWELEEADEDDLQAISEDIFDMKGQRNG